MSAPSLADPILRRRLPQRRQPSPHRQETFVAEDTRPPCDDDGAPAPWPDDPPDVPFVDLPGAGYHMAVKHDEADALLDPSYADLADDQHLDVVVVTVGPRYLELAAERVEDSARLAKALAVVAGLAASHPDLLADGGVVHVCWPGAERLRRVS